MIIPFNALCKRLAHILCNEPQIGGRETATVTEAMNMLMSCKSQGGVSPMAQGQTAMPIPVVPVDENRTLAWFIRCNILQSMQREHKHVCAIAVIVKAQSLSKEGAEYRQR